MKTKNFENKYRKAFNRLITFALNREMGIRDYGDYYMSDWESDSDLIKELVDKQEPISLGNLRIDTSEEFWWGTCQMCGQDISFNEILKNVNRCDNCGWKIDWSEEE